MKMTILQFLSRSNFPVKLKASFVDLVFQNHFFLGIDVEKPKGGFLLGTSPEFEVGLYTAGLILSGGRDATIPITLRDYDLNLKVYCKNDRFMTAYCG